MVETILHVGGYSETKTIKVVGKERTKMLVAIVAQGHHFLNRFAVRPPRSRHRVESSFHGSACQTKDAVRWSAAFVNYELPLHSRAFHLGQEAWHAQCQFLGILATHSNRSQVERQRCGRSQLLNDLLDSGAALLHSSNKFGACCRFDIIIILRV